MSTKKGRSKKVYPLTNITGKLLRRDKEEAEVVNNFFLP